MIVYALVLFVFTYVLMFSFSKYKSYIALGSALLFVLLGFLPVDKIIASIDFNVLLMIFGTMGTVSLFVESRMPNMLADIIIKKATNIKNLTITLALFSAIISAFIDNVVTVLMLVPVTLEVAKKIEVSPVPIVFAISIFSNLEGAATLVGDTTSILLAGAMDMNFMDFFFYQGRIGLFFIVQISLIAATLVLYYIIRKKNRKIEDCKVQRVKDYVPTILLVMTVLTLIGASFIPNTPDLINGYICVFYFLLGLFIKLIRTKKVKAVLKTFREIDFETLLLLASLFVIIGGIKETGAIDKIGEFFTTIGTNNAFIMYTLIVVISVLVSAFIDNIPYVATMLFVIGSISEASGIPSILLYYGLIVGSTLGGNITPIGASANITAIGLLKRNGYRVSNKEYFKYSIPISITAILVGYVMNIFLFLL